VKTGKPESNQGGVDGRMADILRGAFSGPPIPLKKIPKANGEQRAIATGEPNSRRQGARDQTKGT
jgi:hypothetical protein